jgi:hypothetical protein
MICGVYKMQANQIVRIMCLIVGGAILWTLGAQPATACNRTAGCAMDVLLEDHDMMQNGRMSEAMRAGRENVEAFRALQAAPQAASRPPARK